MYVHVQDVSKNVEVIITLKIYVRSEASWELPNFSTFPGGVNPDVLNTSPEKHLDRGGYLNLKEEWKDGGDLTIPSARMLFRAYALLAVHNNESQVKDYWIDQMLMILIHFAGDGKIGYGNL